MSKCLDADPHSDGALLWVELSPKLAHISHKWIPSESQKEEWEFEGFSLKVVNGKQDTKWHAWRIL